ncbi:hypothetical protein B5F40_10470 [Gordonibacter sp. An230]|nr:hypothetical protein B5F40_10470 [Gordonibacter sp. An230]
MRIFDASSYPYEYRYSGSGSENDSDGTGNTSEDASESGNEDETADEREGNGEDASKNGNENELKNAGEPSGEISADDEMTLDGEGLANGADGEDPARGGAFEVYLKGHDELEALLSDDGTLPVDHLAVYDAQARSLFAAWVAEHPESPLAAFVSGGAQNEEGRTAEPGVQDEADSSSESGAVAETGMPNDRMPVSPVGYYLSTAPSPSATALSALFGLLSIAMFPLWFGACIFAAARRFFRTRLEPGISALDAAASKIADRDLDFHVEHNRDDELGHLAASFETMRSSLVASQRALWRTAEERRRLNAAFAHDLRTPLTVLKGKVELLDARLRAGDASAKQLETSTAALSRQVERLERYVEAMSGLQKLEDRVAAPEQWAFDAVATGIDDVGRELAAAAGKRFGLSVSSTCDALRPTLRVDRAIVDEVAENLVSNALRFARTRADARLDVREGMLALTVDDDGPGFSAEALERGCAPFFSETPSESHFGLGLNIASLLCERHGGSLSLANRPEGGARVVARFAMDTPYSDGCAGS